MALEPQLLDLIVCPHCKQKVQEIEDGQFLLCSSCKARYPVHHGVPILLMDRSLRESYRFRDQSKLKDAPKVNFRVSSGRDAGLHFELAYGNCRALARSDHGAEKTSVLGVELALALDEDLKRMVMEYVKKQFQKSGEGKIQAAQDNLSGFVRVADVVLKDSALSRLHCMLFADRAGTVGLLDFVSKNGTYVNGQEVESALLQVGDTVTVGETTFVFEG